MKSLSEQIKEKFGYDFVSPFSEGFAAVLNGPHDQGFHIKPDGIPAYEQRFALVGDFSEGLAAAWKTDDEVFHIKPDGTPAYEQRFGWVGPFKAGMAKVWKDGEYFKIRPDGSRVE